MGLVSNQHRSNTKLFVSGDMRSQDESYFTLNFRELRKGRTLIARDGTELKDLSADELPEVVNQLTEGLFELPHQGTICFVKDYTPSHLSVSVLMRIIAVVEHTILIHISLVNV